MDFRREAIPAENPDAEERRLEEECRQRLECERRAEDVAHEARILRPVHAEVELLHDAGHDAHAEVDEEDRPEELRKLARLLLPSWALRDDGARLEQCKEDGQAERERHEQEVIDGRDGELPPRKFEYIHAKTFFL